MMRYINFSESLNLKKLCSWDEIEYRSDFLGYKRFVKIYYSPMVGNIIHIEGDMNIPFKIGDTRDMVNKWVTSNKLVKISDHFDKC